MGEQCIMNGGVQYVYLDFDGADAQYNNEELNLNIDVTVEDSGISQDRIDEITAQLNRTYADQNIVFVSVAPEFAEYSTIYVGNTDSFNDYGEFYGVSESVDVGNCNKYDDAFVLLNHSYSNAEIISVIEHETNHIVSGSIHNAEDPVYELGDYAMDVYLYSNNDRNYVQVTCNSNGVFFTNRDWTPSFNDGATKVVVTVTNNSVNSNNYPYSYFRSIEIAYTGLTSDDGFLLEVGESWTTTMYLNDWKTLFLSQPTYMITTGIITNGYSITAEYYRDIPIADLRITTASLSRTAWDTVRFDPSESFTYSFTIKNGGDLAAASSKVFIYVDGKKYAEISVSALAVNGTFSYTYTFAPGSLKNGEHSIYVVADAKGVINEASEDNNTGATQKFIIETAKADLAIKSFDIVAADNETILVNEKDFFICATIENCSGNKNSVATTVALYANNKLIKTFVLPSLQAGSTFELKDIIPAGSISAGDVNFKLVVDPNKQCTEFNEENNTSIVTKKIISYTGVITKYYDDIIDQTLSLANTTLANNRSCNTAVVYSGGITNQTTVSSGGKLFVSSGGLASSTVVSSGGVLYIGKSGVADFATIYSSGTVYVSSSGAAGNITISNGGLGVITSGGEISDSYIDRGSATVSSGGTLNNTEVYVGWAYVSSGGTANNITINEGWADVHSGAVMNDSIVDYYGLLKVYGGTLNATLVSGYAAKVWVMWGGVTYDTTVKTGAVHISSGSFAKNTTVSGGSLYISSGGTHSGNLQIEAGAVVSAYAGSTVDFSISDHKTTDSYLINNLSRISGTPVYTITTEVSKANGTYKLAQVAQSLNSSVTIRYDDESYGTLTVNGADLVYQGKTFSLDRVNDNLTLTISGGFTGQITNLQGNEKTLSWQKLLGVKGYTVEYSVDNFSHIFSFSTTGNIVNSFALSRGSYQWRVKALDGSVVNNGKNIVSKNSGTPQSNDASYSDGNMDVFFANANGKWTAGYAASHQGSVNGSTGLNELVILEGKNKIADVFKGSQDANLLVLTDDSNGDALFVEDIYTSFGSDAARLDDIKEIRAGAGDDIIDMTSQRFAYDGYENDGYEMTIRGGLGNDTIWATGRDNKLFGDAGNDRIVGSDGFDLIVGGNGNDSMHTGGGGNDIFVFCQNWGTDTIYLTEMDDDITLWFASGSKSNWDSATRIYRSGSNSVTIIGGDDCSIELKFGNAGGQYNDILSAGAFESATSEKIFEDKNSGMLA